MKKNPGRPDTNNKNIESGYGNGICHPHNKSGIEKLEVIELQIQDSIRTLEEMEYWK